MSTRLTASSPLQQAKNRVLVADPNDPDFGTYRYSDPATPEQPQLPSPDLPTPPTQPSGQSPAPPTSGQPPVPQPSAPTPTLPPPPPVPGATVTPFGPGQDLRYSQITPTASDATKTAAGLAGTAAQNYASAGDLTKVGPQLLQAYIESTQPQFEQDLRGVGQKAAALGRLGAGMTTSDLGDVAQRRNQDIAQRAQTLAGTLAPAQAQLLGSQFGALSGYEGQQVGQDTAAAEALRGERGYQTGMSQQDRENLIQEIALQDSLLNSAAGRNASGAGANFTGGQILSNQAGQQGAAGSDVLAQFSLEDYLRRLKASNPYSPVAI